MSAKAPAATGVPSKSFMLAVPYPESSTGKKVLHALGIAAIVAVVLIIVVVVFSVAMLNRLFGVIAENADVALPPFLCTMWLERRKQSYMGATDPNGEPYTQCSAAAQAVEDARSGAYDTACPKAGADAHHLGPVIYDHLLESHCA